MSDRIEQITRLLEPILRSLGLTLWDLELRKLGPKSLLTVYIDREGTGVTLDDCTAVSRDLGTALDIEDIVSGSYTLEVSSPGLDRALRTPEHYRRSVGKRIRIKTYQAFENQKVFFGILRGNDGRKVLLELDGGKPLELDIMSIASAAWVVEI